MCAGIWIVAAAVASGTQEASPAGVRPAFTTAQAERGREEYTTSCAHCHRSDLLGDERQEIPALAEETFFVRWGGRPL
jgi:cytochrome c553